MSAGNQCHRCSDSVSAHQTFSGGCAGARSAAPPSLRPGALRRAVVRWPESWVRSCQSSISSRCRSRASRRCAQSRRYGATAKLDALVATGLPTGLGDAAEVEEYDDAHRHSTEEATVLSANDRRSGDQCSRCCSAHRPLRRTSVPDVPCRTGRRVQPSSRNDSALTHPRRQASRRQPAHTARASRRPPGESRDHAAGVPSWAPSAEMKLGEMTNRSISIRSATRAGFGRGVR